MKKTFKTSEVKKKRSWNALAACAVAMAAIGSTGVAAFAEKPDNANDEGYIANLIYSTSEEGTCTIPEGDYTVSGITITKPMTIRADGNVTIRPALNETNAASVESNFVFSVWSDGVSIEGLHFKSPYAGGSVGIIHCRGNDLSVRDNTFSLPSNSAAVISYADSNLCMVENNRFVSVGGRRIFPMIQFLDAKTRVCLTGNTLEGAEPEMLEPDYPDCLIALGNKNSILKDNQFEYTGFLTAEDMGGYEDEDFAYDGDEPSAEAFMRIQSNRAREFNPWPEAENMIKAPSRSSSRKSSGSRSSGDVVVTSENTGADEAVKENPKTDGPGVTAPLTLAAMLLGALAVSINRMNRYKQLV